MLQVERVSRGYLSEIFLSFQGEGLHAGRRQLFLRLSGCHLRCRYCDTPGSLERGASFLVHGPNGERVARRNPVTASEVIDHALPLVHAAGGSDGVAVTGGEPLLQAEFLAELLADPRWPQPRLLETSGTQPEKLATVLHAVDVVSMDIKLPSNTGEGEFWDDHARFLAAARGKVYVKILVDEHTAVEEVERAATMICAEAPDIPVFLQPITEPSGRVGMSTPVLDRFFQAARARLEEVRVLPQMHKILGVL